jgi:hypothetical protein
MAYIFDFKYEGGNISQITGVIGGMSGTMMFEHQNNVITGFKLDDDNVFTPLQYNAQTNAYTYIDDNEEYLIDLTESGDIEKYYTEDNLRSDYNFVFLYNEDDDMYGAMYNTNNIHPYMALLYPQLSSFLALMARKPAEALALSDASLFLENQYYDDGFVKSSFLSFADGAERYNFKYMSLKDN